MQQDGSDGLTLPTFSGSLRDDWALHETQLRAWLSIKGIPLHAVEAAQSLVLSLNGSAALVFQNHIPLDAIPRTHFDAAIETCRSIYGGPTRKHLATLSAWSRANSRSFKERGKRQETIQDLVSDLEVLFIQAEIMDDARKRTILFGALHQFPEWIHSIQHASSFTQAVFYAIEYEAATIGRERANMQSRQSTFNSNPASQSFQPPSSTPAPPVYHNASSNRGDVLPSNRVTSGATNETNHTRNATDDTMHNDPSSRLPSSSNDLQDSTGWPQPPPRSTQDGGTERDKGKHVRCESTYSDSNSSKSLGAFDDQNNKTADDSVTTSDWFPGHQADDDRTTRLEQSFPRSVANPSHDLLLSTSRPLRTRPQIPDFGSSLPWSSPLSAKQQPNRSHSRSQSVDASLLRIKTPECVADAMRSPTPTTNTRQPQSTRSGVEEMERLAHRDPGDEMGEEILIHYPSRPSSSLDTYCHAPLPPSQFDRLRPPSRASLPINRSASRGGGGGSSSTTAKLRKPPPPSRSPSLLLHALGQQGSNASSTNTTMKITGAYPRNGNGTNGHSRSFSQPSFPTEPSPPHDDDINDSNSNQNQKKKGSKTGGIGLNRSSSLFNTLFRRHPKLPIQFQQQQREHSPTSPLNSRRAFSESNRTDTIETMRQEEEVKEEIVGFEDLSLGRAPKQRGRALGGGLPP